MLTPGKILQNRRKELKKSLFVVATETKIQERFLRYIEADDYSRFDSGVFVNGFIKIYADYLGLDVERMLALYRRASKQIHRRGWAAKKRNGMDLQKFLTPGNIAILVITAAILAALIYLGAQFYKFQKAPNLDIVSPSSDAIVDTSTVNILGVTDKDSQVFLNGEEIQVDSDGSFEKELILEEGVNTISIEAVNTSSDQKTVEAINVEYKKPDVKSEEKREVKITFKGYVQIVDQEAYIELVVDDKQLYAQTLLPGKTDTFNITDTLQFASWRIENVRLYINGRLYPLISKSGTAMPSISCTIQDNTINCSQ